MKGNAKAIDLLNDVLAAELTAVNQYFVHARWLRTWPRSRPEASPRARQQLGARVGVNGSRRLTQP